MEYQNLNQIRIDNKVRVSDIARATGLTERGIYRLLTDNKLPQNTLLREAFLKALGIKEEA